MGWPTKQDAGSGDEGSQVIFFMIFSRFNDDFFSSRNLLIQDKNKPDLDQIFNLVSSDFHKYSWLLAFINHAIFDFITSFEKI